jgi:hypothetical protein
MSHFTKIKTTLKDLTVLKKSLRDLSVQWEDTQSNNYDIGFAWNGFEYQLVADLQFWQQPWSVELFLDKVTQRYAYNSIVDTTKLQGFKAVEEINHKNGAIKLTLQRWGS